MREVNSMLNYLRYAKTSKLFMASAFVLLSGILLATTTFASHAHQASAMSQRRDCKPNSIMDCGALTPEEFVQKYNQNQSGDLHTVYGAFGLKPEDISRFGSDVKMGEVFKNGDIVVDGKVVATNSETIGRNPEPGGHAITIGGQTYYMTPNDKVFLSDPIPALVLMTGDHVDFFALTACGNTGVFTQPNYQCDMLNSTQISRDTYQFSSKATAENGATVEKVVYEFGDGTTAEKTNPADTVEHTYAQPGNYTAKATVYFNVNGATKTHTSEQCTKPVEVKPAPPKPEFACSVLEGKQLSRTKYEFTATAVAKNGAALEGANFDFGDNHSTQGTKPTDETHVVVQHEYDKPGSYTVTVKVLINVNGQTEEVGSATCTTNITIKPEECKPNIPVGSKECQPTPPPMCTVPGKENFPPNAPECKPPTPPAPPATPPAPTPPAPQTPAALPSTGPTEIVGGTIGLSSIVAAGVHYIRARRTLLDSFLDR